MTMVMIQTMTRTRVTTTQTTKTTRTTADAAEAETTGTTKTTTIRAVAAVTASTPAETPPADFDPPQRAGRPGLSVRTRIIVALALLVTVALISAGVIIYALEGARIKAAAVTPADQELAEFINCSA